MNKIVFPRDSWKFIGYSRQVCPTSKCGFKWKLKFDRGIFWRDYKFSVGCIVAGFGICVRLTLFAFPTKEFQAL